MATIVLDSWALMAYFDDEPGSSIVGQLLLDGTDGIHRLLLCVVNWGEIYYITRREYSKADADLKAAQISDLPIEIVPIATDDLRLARQAAIFKAARKMSYAGCFAAALAKLENAELVTGDREFRAVERDVKIRWLPNR